MWGEFPESGIAPCEFLYAFVGVRAEADGLHVRPRIPKGLAYVGVDGMWYHGRRLKITAYRDRLELQTPSRSTSLRYSPDGSTLITEPMLGRAAQE